jgi:hypothetical protein
MEAKGEAWKAKEKQESWIEPFPKICSICFLNRSAITNFLG